MKKALQVRVESMQRNIQTFSMKLIPTIPKIRKYIRKQYNCLLATPYFASFSLLLVTKEVSNNYTIHYRHSNKTIGAWCQS